MLSLVITGNPGVGKHTIGKKIAHMLDLRLFDLNQIVLDENIFEQKAETKDVDTDELKKRLKNRLVENSLIIGHLAPYVLIKTQVKNVIVLRKNPYKLLAIYKKRKYTKDKIRENIQSEILGIIAHDAIKNIGRAKIHQIDTTGKSVQNITLEIKNSINGKKHYDIVDWLAMVLKNNDLKKFFL